jgi:hypothetical protein
MGLLLSTETDGRVWNGPTYCPHRHPNSHCVALPHQKRTVFEITLLNDFVKDTFFDFSEMFTDRSWSDSNDLADVLK